MSVKDTKEGDPVPRWNLGGLAGPSELWTCKRLRLEQLILKRDRQVRILKVSPKNSELELALNFVPCASKSFYEASAFFSEICFLCIEYRNPDYKVDDHHHPAHCNELKEFDPPKKKHLHAGSPSLHGTAGPEVPPAANILRPAKLNPLVTRWHGTFPLRNMTWYGNIAESDCQRLPFQQDLHCMQEIVQLVISVLI